MSNYKSNPVFVALALTNPLTYIFVVLAAVLLTITAVTILTTVSLTMLFSVLFALVKEQYEFIQEGVLRMKNQMKQETLPEPEIKVLPEPQVLPEPVITFAPIAAQAAPAQKVKVKKPKVKEAAKRDKNIEKANKLFSKGLTRKEIAEKIGVSASTVSRWLKS